MSEGDMILGLCGTVVTCNGEVKEKNCLWSVRRVLPGSMIGLRVSPELPLCHSSDMKHYFICQTIT